jgi:hypothetical protein
MTTKYLDGVQQVEKTAKLATNANAATWQYSSFPVGTSVFLSVQNCITPHAQKRLYVLGSTLNQPLTNASLRPMLYTFSAGTSLGTINGYGTGVGTISSIPAGSNLSTYDNGLLGDALYFVATVGATAPTSGSLILKIAEVI